VRAGCSAPFKTRPRSGATRPRREESGRSSAAVAPGRAGREVGGGTDTRGRDGSGWGAGQLRRELGRCGDSGCWPKLGHGTAASCELGRPKNGRRKSERAAGRKWASSPVGEKGLRAEMKKGGERNEETFFFLFLEFFKSIFKWI